MLGIVKVGSLRMRGLYFFKNSTSREMVRLYNWHILVRQRGCFMVASFCVNEKVCTLVTDFVHGLKPTT
jgi:hypothetical protein